MDLCGTKSSIRWISGLKSVTQHNVVFCCCFLLFILQRWCKQQVKQTLPLTWDCLLLSLFLNVYAAHTCLLQGWPWFVSDLQLSCTSVEVWVCSWCAVGVWFSCGTNTTRGLISHLFELSAGVAEPWPQTRSVNYFSQVAIAGGSGFGSECALKAPMSWWTPCRIHNNTFHSPADFQTQLLRTSI